MECILKQLDNSASLHVYERIVNSDFVLVDYSHIDNSASLFVKHDLYLPLEALRTTISRSSAILFTKACKYCATHLISLPYRPNQAPYQNLEILHPDWWISHRMTTQYQNGRNVSISGNKMVTDRISDRIMIAGAVFTED